MVPADLRKSAMARRTSYRGSSRNSSNVPYLVAGTAVAGAGVIAAAIAFTDADDWKTVIETPLQTTFQCAGDNGNAKVYAALADTGLTITGKNGEALYTDFGANGSERQKTAAQAFCDSGALPGPATEHRGYIFGNYDCTGRNGQTASVTDRLPFVSTRVDIGDQTTFIHPNKKTTAVSEARQFCAGGENPLGLFGRGLHFE